MFIYKMMLKLKGMNWNFENNLQYKNEILTLYVPMVSPELWEMHQYSALFNIKFTIGSFLYPFMLHCQQAV